MAYIIKNKPRLFTTVRPDTFRHYLTVFGDAENIAGEWLLYCLTVYRASISVRPQESVAARAWRICSAILMTVGACRQQLADAIPAAPLIVLNRPLLVMKI